jgi:epoxide hydrolase
VLDPDLKVPYWNEHAEGAHFPAMEVPDVLVDDLRAFFRAYR